MYTGPNIPTNGLVLSLDAANTKSYVSGSGTWFDVSGNGNSGSLVNGPTFDPISAGSIQFDGVDDYCSILSNDAWKLATSSTLNIWYNASSFTGNIICYQKSGWIGYQIIPNRIYYSGQNGSNDYDVSWNYALNTWCMFTWIVDRTLNLYSIYVNGIQSGISQAIVHPAISTTTPLYLGARGSVPDQFLTGKIANVSLYTKALSATEISQIYNSQKSRFNL